MTYDQFASEWAALRSIDPRGIEQAEFNALNEIRESLDEVVLRSLRTALMSLTLRTGLQPSRVQLVRTEERGDVYAVKDIKTGVILKMISVFSPQDAPVLSLFLSEVNEQLALVALPTRYARHLAEREKELSKSGRVVDLME